MDVRSLSHRLTVAFALACTAVPLAACAQDGTNAGAADGMRHARQPYGAHCRASIGSAAFARTELYFGLSSPDGVIDDARFQQFVEQHVTPRFPDGHTMLGGSGQFRDASGQTIVEGSKLLILLYPRHDANASERIEAIRSEYRVAFRQQQSVLRTDDVSCVSF